MLPRAHRLHRSSDFGAVVRRGARKGRRTVVVYVLVDPAPVREGGPRFGLVVSKAVGDAVTRHRVSRRLRHVCGSVLSDGSPGLVEGLDDDLLVVLRALPASAAASSSELDRDVRVGVASAIRRVRA